MEILTCNQCGWSWYAHITIINGVEVIINNQCSECGHYIN